jgi:hypothetical protein
MSERYWTITGHENGLSVFTTTIAVDDIAESEVKSLLQMLAARGLTEDEIVAATLDEGALEISRTEGDAFGFTTLEAGGRTYTATLGDTIEDPLDEPATDESE